VHARKAILGLSTAANRLIPPLRHEWVFRLAALFPELRFELNGHVQDIEEANSLLCPRPIPQILQTHDHEAKVQLHGVMIGRAAYNKPWMFYLPRCPEDRVPTTDELLSRKHVAKEYCKYARGVLHEARLEAATKTSLLSATYRPHTNATVFKKDAKSSNVPATFFATGCKAVHSISELCFRLSQPLLNLFACASSECAEHEHRACGLLKKLHHALAKAVKANKEDLVDEAVVEGIFADIMQGGVVAGSSPK